MNLLKPGKQVRLVHTEVAVDGRIRIQARERADAFDREDFAVAELWAEAALAPFLPTEEAAR